MRDLVHIHQTTALAERVLLPGDPGRALRLAQALLSEPKMLNHNRGLWGYTGTAADGLPLSIQSTGMGGPSAAIVASELIELGAERLLRIGTCGGLSDELELGQLVVVPEAIADDGTSCALGGHERFARVAAPGLLSGALLGVAEAESGIDSHPPVVPHPPTAVGPVVSADLFYDAEGRVGEWIAAGAVAVEMETAAIFTLAAKRGVEAGCVVLVSNFVVGGAGYMEPDALHGAELRLGELAITALS